MPNTFTHPAITPPKPTINLLSDKELAMCKRAILKRIQYCHYQIKQHPKTYKLLYTQEIADLHVLMNKLESILNAR